MFEERIEKAVEFFKSGYNCSQSVVLAFADMYGFTQEQAARMAASFGGGVVCVRLVALHAVCFCLPDWKPERLIPKIVKEKGPIMQ